MDRTLSVSGARVTKALYTKNNHNDLIPHPGSKIRGDGGGFPYSLSENKYQMRNNIFIIPSLGVAHCLNLGCNYGGSFGLKMDTPEP